MSNLYFTSDWHLGHYNVRKWREEEDQVNASEHDELLFDNYVSVVKKDDVVWFLGDMVITRDDDEFDYYLTRLKALPGRKRLILGNHCTDWMSGRRSPVDLLTVFEQVHGMYKVKRAWLSHAPMHPQELRGRINIHGHMHRDIVSDERYVNVCVEQTDFTPMRYQGWLQDHAERVWQDNKDYRRS